ncbi:organic cation/carnitine transporter 7 [Aplysia californica]|uniref:Organic cation/carnitine transporter 7 n=1 Tax=Aplysia californica TaxID=6500 RepID=A0ABM0JQZ1_APLCA|nr:organic cation/carnitine transporter 7 [Aplysia californica]
MATQEIETDREVTADSTKTDGSLAISCTLTTDSDEKCSTTALLTEVRNGAGAGENSNELDNVLSSIKVGQFHWRMLALVGWGYFAVCSEMMLFIFLSSPVKEEWNLRDMDFPWLPFSTGIAGIVGGFVFGTVSDRYGRQLPFLFGILVIAIFGVVSAFAPSFPVFIVFRCLVTIGTGAFEAVGFVLLLEFLPRQQRGTILVVVTLCGALGAVLAGGFAWLILPRWGWRWFVGVCALPAVLLLAYQPFAFFESPRFLVSRGQRDKAIAVLRRMAEINKCELPSLDKIVCTPRQKRGGHVLHLFSKELRSRTFFFSVTWFLQATGYWGVTVYLPEYMARLGADPYFNMFSVFIGEIPGLFLAMLLVEKYMLGRIRTLRFFSVLTALSLLIFSFIPEHEFKSVLIIICYFSMVPIYSILNTYTPEVYPTDLRSTAMAWMNIVIEVPGLVTPFVGATLLSSSLPWLYPVVWGSVFVVQCLVTFGLRTETAGRDLRDFEFGSHKVKNSASSQSVDC